MQTDIELKEKYAAYRAVFGEKQPLYLLPKLKAWGVAGVPKGPDFQESQK